MLHQFLIKSAKTIFSYKTNSNFFFVYSFSLSPWFINLVDEKKKSEMEVSDEEIKPSESAVVAVVKEVL